MLTSGNKTAIVSVINDLATDQRVQRTCGVLAECGYDVVLVGRKLKNSPPVSGLPYRTKRMKLLFTSGPLFYFFFNLRLFFFLLFSKADLLFANDLDTLWPNHRVAKWKRIPLIYDSHEIFCEVPELQRTPFKKKTWERLERAIVPKLRYCVTVNDSIAGYFKEKCGVDFTVVRNIPAPLPQVAAATRAELGLPENKKIVLMQGAGINIERGAEELVLAMKQLNDVLLLIIGGGDVFPTLKTMVKENGLEDKVRIIDKLPKEKLVQYTRHADIGVSIDKDSNLNYHFSLPNKLFDYIQAGVPVLASPLPELKKIISGYTIGDFIEGHEPGQIARKINEMLHSGQYDTWKQNTRKAAAENTWDQEKNRLAALIKSAK